MKARLTGERVQMVIHVEVDHDGAHDGERVFWLIWCGSIQTHRSIFFEGTHRSMRNKGSQEDLNKDQRRKIACGTT